MDLHNVSVFPFPCETIPGEYVLSRKIGDNTIVHTMAVGHNMNE